MTEASLTVELEAHLPAGGAPIRYISADEAAFYRSRAEILRGAAIDRTLRVAARALVRLFRGSVPQRLRRPDRMVTAG